MSSTPATAPATQSSSAGYGATTNTHGYSNQSQRPSTATATTVLNNNLNGLSNSNSSSAIRLNSNGPAPISSSLSSVGTSQSVTNGKPVTVTPSVVSVALAALAATVIKKPIGSASSLENSYAGSNGNKMTLSSKKNHR
jgi:hypothetical protein